MSGYDNAFDFNAIPGAYDMPGSLNAEPTPAMDQSGTWNTALYPQSGLMEGGTAAQLHAQVDFAPFEGARSIGGQSCGICLATFHTASALDKHAKAAKHQAYKCKCGTDFNNHSALRRHVDTKDAPKMFACTLCYDKFNRNDKLKDHCRQYHRVTDQGLRVLFNSQGTRPCAAASRRHRAPVPLAADSPASVPDVVAAPPTLASAPAVPSAWSFPTSTGQQHASFSPGLFNSTDLLATASPFVPTDSFGLAGAFVPTADPFASTPVPGEDISGTLDGVFGDETWATGFDGFNF